MSEGSRLALYNQVVWAYNQLGPLSLRPVPTLHQALDSPHCSWVGYFLLALLPGLNFLVFLVLLVHLVSFCGEIRAVWRNQRAVPNPFEHMFADADLVRPFLTRTQLQNRLPSGHCTVSSESIVQRSSEAAERTYYRPELRGVYERMLLSGLCSCLFACVLVLVSLLSVGVDLCWVADEEGWQCLGN